MPIIGSMHCFMNSETFFKTPRPIRARWPSKEETRMHRFGLRAPLLALAAASRDLRGHARRHGEREIASHHHHLLADDERPGDRDAEEPRQPVRGVAPRHQDRHGDRAVRSARPEVHDRRAGGPGARRHARRHRPRRAGLGGPGPAHRPDLDDLGEPTRPTSSRRHSRAPSTTGRSTRVPQTVDALALFYNKALFKAKGLTTPPTTLAQLAAVLPEVRRRQGHRPPRRLLLDRALDLGLRRRPRRHGEEADPDRARSSRSPAGARTTRSSRTSARSRTRTSRTTTAT